MKVLWEVPKQHAPASFSKIHLMGARVDKIQPMTFDEFRKKWRQMRDNNANAALRYFNHQNDEFKFCVLTLANRESPKSFKPDEIGKPFQYFEEERRRLIIIAMNKMARWGSILPRQFSTADCFLPE
ncbi:hypothetical protein F3I27_15125 [Pantoea sp. Bo_2]|nr:hypothetical protein F3I57_12665 [Pantoea sp. VH_3]KAA5951608.1 hypothetical protein F3I56_13170 [Pantoea sp. VH_25]KAA5981538.1 hypothetical protein F3I48_14020 [Pantoea sp. M_3]KAA6044608.1 hypothetical protein F3I36_14180 [Pantoea sp. FN_2b]KAA6049033.1 hypothetical protein F3I34_15130 [Pantoea sp. Bo_5]KAA6057514.1 hypothetical protein F3I33_14940 [Pantoea sp. Bo_46]KAA6058043.1 hypothetical protein F3I32_15125 [Pantoea sp. Bo_40]KAA6062023.1 hypothetical protein F3I29_14945 [Pantoea 